MMSLFLIFMVDSTYNQYVGNAYLKESLQRITNRLSHPQLKE
jgi:hypothetical protein